MSDVILASSSRELARNVRLASGDDLTVITPEQVPTGPAQLVALVADADRVRCVILDVREGQTPAEPALDLAKRFERQMPGVSVLLVTDRPEDMGLAALRAGVKDLIDPRMAVDEIRWLLRRASDTMARITTADHGAESFAGRVITVASPKGGVGKTTLSTNLAVALAGQSPEGTVLVDLDVQFGDVAAALDLDPAYTLADITAGSGLRDAMTLKTLLAQHRSGLYVVCGVKSPAEADSITASQIGQLLALLKQEFRFVVIDTAPGMSEQTLAAIDHTTDLVLITSMDVPGVRGLRKELELLEELDLQPSTRHVVVNFASKDTGLTIKDVEATIRRKVDVVLPRSTKFTRSTNQGSPMVESQPRDGLTKEILTLVARFAPVQAAGRWSGRHRGRSTP